ncbi:MAG: hypothetical protein CVT95_12700 [Bacteroidetes bacterium HGW-Bacteroidetes-12]|nr:MAG: hypothetical protein CVT95_12700 [Bacteroidetes bacterium HGW-Bacteroidetes-12]
MIISTALIIIFFYEDKIKDVIVSELNENLNTEIVVKNIDLELFKKFPNASITFKEVTIKDAIPDSVKGDLFTAKRIYLLFSVIDIFTGNYNISKIECKEGFAKILIYKNGKDNYHFWKEINDSISDNQRVNPLVVNLKKLIFNDMGFYFKDFKKAQQFNGLINKLYFKGNFSKDIYDMSVNGDVFVNKISNKDDNFISNNSVEISSNINVDNTTNKYTITEGKLILEKIVFNIDGFLIYNDLTQFIDAKLTGENIEILTVINSLPATYSAYLDKYKTKGIIQLSSTVKGEIKTGKIPEIKAFFTLSDGYFKEKTSRENVGKTI